ncbi:hypothetical protein QO002_000775 [Pararhizobium capsulatum DSM 1112]|uniref:Uncharacterized protein n=1 Tax=Pararhizobium capsulatum DSM 1112 TaxID=1121113 RepID=A0ABU0BP24_9HYPH|nr:hypothetical protein [Pararhizobium capsulatum]MDQ0318637.1 hypothetical protein [Pararhizobium capsulatum DSM 1112]
MSGGQSAHPGADFSALLERYNALPEDDLEARLALIANDLPGGGTVGLVAAQQENYPLVERCRAAIGTMFDNPVNGRKTGIECELGLVPAIPLDPRWALLLSSSVLTPDDIREVMATVKAKGGGEFSVPLLFHRQRSGSCAGVHTEGVVVPDKKEDGEPISLSILLVPDETGQKVAADILREVTGCDRLVPWNRPTISPGHLRPLPTTRSSGLPICSPLSAENTGSRPWQNYMRPTKAATAVSSPISGWIA